VTWLGVYIVSCNINFGETTPSMRCFSVIMKLMNFVTVLSVSLFHCLLCDYTDNIANDVNTHRLSIGSVDTSAIYEGVLKPENIAIHVAQNMVNIIVSTLAWAVISHFYQVRKWIFYNCLHFFVHLS
jgi:hypothetical protein